jgi:hypothetical protein
VGYAPTHHFTVGGRLAVYPTGGGFSLGDMALEYQGVHLDLLRVGFSQKVSRRFRMELALLLGASVLKEPGYVGVDESMEEGTSRVGYHWGASLSGHYRFPVGVTLGLGTEIDFAFGPFLDTSLFRVAPAVGWALEGPLDDWFLHLRWQFGLTLLHGLDELNSAPESNLSLTGLEVVYGF